MDKAKLIKKSNTLVSRITVITLTFMMLVTGMQFSVMSPLVAHAEDPVKVSSWADLKAKIENAHNGDVIVIAKDIVAEGETINIGNKITIKGGANGAKIMRKKGDSNFPLFTTQDGAELILGEKLTLTGKQRDGECPPNSGFTVTYTNGADKSDTKDIAAGQEVYINRPAADWTPGNGYIFKGWKFKTPSGQVQSTSGNQDICSTGFYVPTDKVGEMKLVAEYEKKEFKVIWSNGVSGDNEKTTEWSTYATEQDKLIPTGALKEYTPPADWAPEEGYVFVGWEFKRSENANPESTKGTDNIYKPDFNVTSDLVAEMKIVAQWEKPASGGNMSGKFLSSAGYLRTDGYSIKVYNNASYASTIEFEAKGGKIFVKMNGKYLKARQETDAISFTDSSNNAIHLTDAGGTPVSSFANNTSYFMKDGQFGYVYAYDGQLYANGNAASLSWSSSDATGGGGDAETYDSSDPSYTPKQPEVYPTTDEPTYSESTPSQGCDGNCTTYTTDDFSSGTTDAPRGFFVEVAKGTVTLQGATLENFQTDPGVSNAAPVVVNQGTFEMSGGAIQHNSVGYSANNNHLSLTANKIGKEGNTGDYSDTGKLAEYTRTATAGAVLLTNGASGSINGGSISDNRADTGAIVVQGNPDKKGDTVTYTGDTTKLFLNDGTNISNNVGVHNAGAVYVYNGAYVEMNNGANVTGNFSWDKGGAFWIREEIYGSNKKGVSKKVADATFVMNGGTISENGTINRGGAIEVMSNHVALLGGSITNNTSRVLGGAIYVEGDGPTRNYRLYIRKGNIVENTATNPNNIQALQKRVNTTDATCGKVNNFDNGAGSNIADRQDFNNHYGFGGGIWLCPIGGSAALTTPDNQPLYDVFIGDNTADSGKGKDIRIQPFRGGAINGINIYNEGEHNDFYTGAGAQLKNGKTYNGPVNIYNKETRYRVEGGVTISGNMAAAGGAIASNGIVMLGGVKDVYKANASLKVKKKWSGQIESSDRKPVTVKLYAKVDGKRGNEPLSEVYLNGKADEQVIGTGETDNPVDQKNDEYGENTAAYEPEKWLALFGVPLIGEVGSEEKSLVILEADGEEINPSTIEGVDALVAAVKADKKITIKKWNVEVVEVDENGNELVYKLPNGEVTLKTDINNEETDSIKTPGGDEIAKFTTGNIDMEFTNTIGNDGEPEIEKYVNEAVHKPISVDEVFKYDILAYVSMDADKITITDKLVDELEFAPDKEVTILDIGEKVNHKVNNDVSGNETGNNGSVGIEEGDPIIVEGDDDAKATTISGDGVTINTDTDSNTLTVTLDNTVTVDKDAGTVSREYDTVTKLRGHWVKVSFYAQLSEDIRNGLADGSIKVSELPNVPIKHDETYKPEGSIYEGDENRPEPNKGNQPVDSDEDHDGIINTASYAIDVVNEAKYKDESNTVTVKPEEPAVEKYVNHAVHKDIALDEVFTYDILAYVTKDADSVIITDPLVKDLEFVNTDDIKVASLDSNNHKPEKNISGKIVSSDASVAGTGTIITPDNYSLSTENNTLTITLDDEVGDDGSRGKEVVKNLRGKWIKVTFQAQIKESIQAEIKAGTKTIEKLDNVTVSADENDPVLSNEAHSGINNNASYTIEVENEPKYKLGTNIVTVKPEVPEIEKYVNEAVHDYIDLNEEFTYDIIAYVTKDADTVLIKDPLDNQLEFVGESSDVEVTDLGKSNNHKPVNDIYSVKINDDATVAEKGSKIDNAVVNIEDNMLSVSIPDASSLRGNWVKVTFKAKIKTGLGIDDLTYTAIDPDAKENRDAPNVGNDPVVSKERHDGVPNKASYEIVVNNGAEIEKKHKDESNTVTVKPEEPEIEKFVDQAVHKDINIDDEFTYDIVAFVTDDAATVKITDELDKQLQFVSTEKDVKIADLGKTNNHKVTNDIASVKVNDDASVAEEGDKITDAEVSINGNKLVVDIPNATAYRGHWVKVTFKARIADGKKVKDLKYTEIKDADEEKRDAPNVGNDPVISDEDHKGVPNKASYEIGVKNSAGKVETKYDDESNTVTVKPDEIPVYFSKKELEGDELEGAKIVVKDEEGNVIEEWVSTKESHRIDLKPGKYSMQEVVAPDGFQRVTTTIWFEVNENGKVTLLTAEVDNGGKISIMDADHIILEDAPVKNPLLTIKKTSKITSAMPGDVIDYVITIENSGDGDAEAVEVVDTMDNNLTYVSDNSNGVNDGQKVTWTVDVAAGKTKTIKIKCRIDEDASGKTVNKAEITNYETEYVDNGDDEHDIVLGVYDDVDDNDDKKPASKDKSKTKGARTGDSTHVVLWSIMLILTLALAVVLRIRRRYQR